MNTLTEQLERIKLVPVVVLNDVAHAVPLAKTLLENGCPCMEVTFRTEAAAESIAAIFREVPGMLIGAGTLLTPEQVEQAQLAGATFGVAPGFDPAVVAKAKELDFPFVPGISTASDMSQALAMGWVFHKFLPEVAAVDTAMHKSLMGAFRHTGIRIMPTGGVNAANMDAWLSIPEVVACGGSWMCEPALIQAENWVEIGRRTAEAISNL